jgi:hypothetical protein
MGVHFEPDEPITSLKVKLHTANVSDASTDSDIFVELFDWPQELKQNLPPIFTSGPYATEIDTDNYNDFEQGNTDWYELPSFYYGGRIVNDIRRICLHKGDDSGSGWGFGWIRIDVNGRELWTSRRFAETPDDPIWLEDGDSWCDPDFKPIEFVAPSIVELGLRDWGSDKYYIHFLHVVGGRKPLTWQILTWQGGGGDAFDDGPRIATLPMHDDGTEVMFVGHTVATQGTATWSGVIQVTDADGRKSSKKMSMKVTTQLPPPSISSFTPNFGWPPLPPAEPGGVVVTVAGKNFDSRPMGFTRVFFNGTAGQIEGKVVDLTASGLKVKVPTGAISGPLFVKTPFGEGTSSASFTAHRNGFRFIGGYSFYNTTKDDDSSDGFPNVFAWERFEQTFGLCDMWLCVLDQAVAPDPVATLFYATAHDTIDNGCCHGFSLLALQMRYGIVSVTPFQKDGRKYPLDDALWDMTGPNAPSTGLSNWIQSRQLVMFSDEAMSYYLEKLDDIPNVDGELCEMDARPALEDMKLAIASGLSDPRMIAFAKNCAPWDGHVVVPYAVEAPGGAFEQIRVYDPNKPAATGDPSDQNSLFEVDTDNGKWSYQWSSGGVWRGLYMFTIPLSRYGYQDDWSIPGLDTLLGTTGILLGSAGVGGGARLVQVSDAGGRELLNRDGSTVMDRSRWPAGAAAVPMLSPRDGRARMVALTRTPQEPSPLTFTVAPAPGRGQAGEGLFALTRSGGSGFSVEGIEAILGVRVAEDADTGGNRVEIAPVEGSTSVIARFAQRLPESSGLTYAIRARDITTARPLVASSTADGRSVILRPQEALTFDLEVTHVSGIGQVRTLECDGIEVPGGSTCSIGVEDIELLEEPGAAPIVLDVDPGAGGDVDHWRLGRRLTGPHVSAPHRVVRGRPLIAIGPGDPSKLRGGVQIPITGSTGGEPDPSLRFRSLSGVPLSDDGEVLTAEVAAGTHPVRIVAEDGAGRRSFPRTVFVTIPEPNHRPIPPLTLFGRDADAQPGSTVSIAIGAYLMDQPINRVVFDLSARERRAGEGPEHPELVSFALSDAISSIGGAVTAEAGRGGITLHVEVQWDATHQLTGRIDVGTLSLTVPASTRLGSTFVLRGLHGTAASSTERIEHALNVLPIAVRVWGGIESAALTIEGPEEVPERGQIDLRAVVGDAEAGSGNEGWWVESGTGRARVSQDPGDGRMATLTGQRAGLVRVVVVVGTTTADKVIRVTPAIRPNLLGSSIRIRTEQLRPLASMQILEQAIERAGPLIRRPIVRLRAPDN